MRDRPRVLFLCTGNACRSPMAEGWLRHLAADRYESLSAGSHAAGFVHPLSIRAMVEVGVDISDQESKSIGEFIPPRGTPPDVLVRLCDFAAAHCPELPAATRVLDWPLFDPILARGSDDEQMIVYRRVRDTLRTRIEEAIEQGLFNSPARRR